MANTDDKVIKNAQYRKGLSIAFFNATNAAVSIVSQMGPQMDAKKTIVEIRDWLLEEHKKYYAEVIAKVGTNYDAAESVKKLKAVKNQEELKAVWLSFSEDERQDAEIRKVAQELKKTLK